VPQHKPRSAISNLNTSVHDATENHATVSAVNPPNCTPLNDPG
jgi:hypothetical protein